jgi:hypothetical protein
MIYGTDSHSAATGPLNSMIRLAGHRMRIRAPGQNVPRIGLAAARTNLDNLKNR